MNQALQEKIESEQYRKDKAAFNVGDTVRVHTKVVEGDKERIQIFSGVVIGKRGRGLKVPDVLLSGNHAEIEKWRREQATQRTRERRPDLLDGQS